MAHRMSKSVFTRFRSVAQERSDASFMQVMEETARIYGVAARVISYGEMLGNVVRRQAEFRSRGYGLGHRVGLLLQNRPEFLEIWFALNGLGVSVVPINPDLRSSELEYVVAHSDMDLAIVLEDRVAEMAAAARSAGRHIPVVAMDQPIPPPHSGARTATEGDEATECALLYTSGTTGRPKGCVLTNEYFLYSGEWYRDAGGLISLGGEGERMLTPLPAFHMNAMATSVMAMITVGGCLVMLDRFHPASWWEQVRESRATCVHYLGVMPSMLMGAPASERDRDHKLRFGFGAGVDKRLHEPFEQRFGFPLLEAWAMTETGAGGCIAASKEPRKIGTSCFGHPTPDIEIRIVTDDGLEAERDMPGELLVRRSGANPRFGFFKEYLKDPEATREVWKDGWFHTGDIVARDGDGDLHFVDRKKNVIRRSGENIAAVEVETVLNRHPLVRQAGVAATPDKIRGDEVAALIVLRQDQHDGAVAEGIVKWALGQMAYYKVPGWVGFVDRLPVTATEKIQRAGLKDLVSQAMSSGAFYDLRQLKRRQV